MWTRLAACLLLLLGSAPALAQAAPGVGPWTRGEQADLRLIAARDASGQGEVLRAGLEFALKGNWKIYWRSPGDAGYPPSVDWSESTNVAGVEMAWPAPERFSVLGIDTIGYHDHVILPLSVRPAEPGAGVELVGAVDYLICDDICIPASARVALSLPGGAGSPGAQAHALARFEARVPGDGAAHGLALVGATLIPGDGARPPGLAVEVTAEPPLGAPDLLVELGEMPVFRAPEVSLSEGGRRAILTAPADPALLPEGGLEGRPLTLTVIDGARGLEATLTPPLGTPAPAAPAAAEAGLALMLGLALLGGLILNLMPCVLPVLSLKVLGVLGHGGAPPAQVRAGFLASAAGVVVTFLALGGVAIGLKAAGLAVGWGIQFQQPVFLGVMALLLTLFAANLWGFFQVPLPGFLGNLGGAENRGETTDAPSLAGHFGTGVLATILATPCSAPFLGTAVGFALARGWLEIGLIFLFLGLGMALPYLAVAAVPAVARRLPRPGAWMNTLKAVLGAALAATAVWLITVLWLQVGARLALVMAGLMVALLVALAARALMEGRGRAIAGGVAVLLLVVGVALPALRPAVLEPAPVAADALWQPFAKERIAGLVAEGKVVVVDVTAQWCITCRVNKLAVLDREPVLGRLSAPGVVPLRADWTNPDPAIGAYLATFERYGIPFNAVYGPGAPEGLVLPELLTEGAVLEALDRAAGE
ncbi:protein-disulfide reductase DsbD family protein [Roseospirillum parvum]|uniref:Suppressor for copper-sensitivity B n=1 Tax=Roseospirillum parvum TaxID=83401 RepID=A0A1G8DJ79_9PROT|nr:protein-disulfide reductase DsbD domain-containing protein [Roseospirillum parvum]SDH57712.1 suppressor for copper-sensitivity B [Roseospirillum parvum]